MIQLKDITLISITGIQSELALKALLISSDEIEFGKIKLIAFDRPKYVPDKVEFIKIKKLNYSEYNMFCLYDLYKYVDTEFCLLVQYDGFVINPSAWDDKFYNYDYIGAPWYMKSLNHGRVGNGGFSLRSKKLILHSKDISINDLDWRDEDNLIVRKILDNPKLKMRVPSLQTAYKFSVEHKMPEFPWTRDFSFGFHYFFEDTFNQKKLIDDYVYTEIL